MKGTEGSCSHKNFDIIKREETYPVRGEDTTIIANVKVCRDCGKEVFDYTLDSDNLKRAFFQYKKKHSLLNSNDIVMLRKKYNISQRTLAKLIGCSQATIVRYEKGDIQNNTHNSVMRMLQYTENFKELAELKEDELDSNEIKNIKEALVNQIRDNTMNYWPMDTPGEFHTTKADQYSGFIEFDFNKFSLMVQYFAENVKELYKTKLLKLLWFTDMYYFKEYTVSMSGSRYLHQHYGPVPQQYSLLLGMMERSGIIRIDETITPYGYGEIITTTKSSKGQFSEDETEILSSVLKKYGNMSATKISDLSHKQKGYIETSDMECISYLYAMDLK
ncbi:type II TA system antitoxin MqsA family protein [Butyrivibrio sp. INlla16]|uniref:type II TA system antitoxin MqsA family protein n=1 Tax=Butyrivibrio sp. INlla16 TaxID=1520807 RepID=UPI00088321B0|nr:type II TA system antitoxin MqsA family protein [Butyrivibrio sp. INlla16]SDB66297.1 putative zinc finger/helix-turn-helix protein, YgiT family [Butyrivibrio sp. INlla16]